MPSPLPGALDAAAAQLSGQLLRTSASVIGHRGGESIIFAITGWGYTVTVMMKGMRIGFVARQRGLLRKTLHVEGHPIDLVNEILDEAHRKQLVDLQALVVEMGPAALRIEHRYGNPAEIATVIDVAVSLARRARAVEQSADAERFARTA